MKTSHIKTQENAIIIKLNSKGDISKKKLKTDLFYKVWNVSKYAKGKVRKFNSRESQTYPVVIYGQT